MTEPMYGDEFVQGHYKAPPPPPLFHGDADLPYLVERPEPKGFYEAKLAPQAQWPLDSHSYEAHQLQKPEFHGWIDDDWYQNVFEDEGMNMEDVTILPREFQPDDKKFMIPKGKAKPLFVDPETDAQQKARLEEEKKRNVKEGIKYGESYESAKKSERRQGSLGVEPRNPTQERKKPVELPVIEEKTGLMPRKDKVPELIIRKPCFAYGDHDKCDGMMCEEDTECSSGCCSRITAEGYKQCSAVIEGGYCPRAMAPKIDYSNVKEEAKGSS